MTMHRQVLLLLSAAAAVGVSGSSGPAVALPYEHDRQLQSALCGDALVACAGEMFTDDGKMACLTCSTLLGECVEDYTTSEWVGLCFPCGPQSEEDIKSFYEGICGDFTEITEDYILSCYGQPPDCPDESDDYSTTDDFSSTTDDDFSSSHDDYYYTDDDYYFTTDDDYYFTTDDDYSFTTDDDFYVTTDDDYYFTTDDDYSFTTDDDYSFTTDDDYSFTTDDDDDTTDSDDFAPTDDGEDETEAPVDPQTNGAALVARICGTTGLLLANGILLFMMPLGLMLD